MKVLYPSLDWIETVRIVGKILEETEVEYKNIDYKKLGKYLAIHMTPEEITKDSLQSVVPKKVKPNRVTIAFLDSDVDRKGEDKWDWAGKRKDPTRLQKKRMVARTTEIAIHTILSNHMYQMDGKAYKQESGGPIGLEITGVLARIVMLWWYKEFMKKMKVLKLDLWMYKRYVDDGNLGVEVPEPGTRFVRGRLSILPEALEEDELIAADIRTAKLVKSVANSITPMIEMEEECPSYHPTGKMPTLDLAVWIENGHIIH